MGRHAGDAAGKNLAALGHEFFQQIGVFVIDRFDRDVEPAWRHGEIGAAKCGSAFSGLGLHRKLFGFAMKRVLTQKRIVFLFFEPVRRLLAFLVPLGHITRNRFAKRLRFGAFEGDNFLGHKVYSRILSELFLGFSRWRRFFFLTFAAFVIGQTEERSY